MPEITDQQGHTIVKTDGDCDFSAKQESGWVIERHINSELFYWGGKFTDDRGFEAHADNAVRFARQQDAMTVLSWLLDRHGRVAEHVWTESE